MVICQVVCKFLTMQAKMDIFAPYQIFDYDRSCHNFRGRQIEF